MRYRREFDVSLLVAARDARRLERAVSRGMERADAAARMRAQWPQSRKERLADLVLRNDGPVSDLRRAVRECHQAFRLMTAHQGDR